MAIVNKFVVTYDVETGEITRVDEIFSVDRKYRKNCYRADFRLNFYEKDFNILESDEMKNFCFEHIVERMTTDKLWKSHDSFYVLTYKVRLLEKTITEFLSEQKALEVHDKLQYAGDSYSSHDSAYITLLRGSSRDVSSAAL